MSRGPLLCVAACPRAPRLSALKPADALTRHALLPVMDTESPQRSQSHFLLINRALAFCQGFLGVFRRCFEDAGGGGALPGSDVREGKGLTCMCVREHVCICACMCVCRGMCAYVPVRVCCARMHLQASTAGVLTSGCCHHHVCSLLLPRGPLCSHPLSKKGCCAKSLSFEAEAKTGRGHFLENHKPSWSFFHFKNL